MFTKVSDSPVTPEPPRPQRAPAAPRSGTLPPAPQHGPESVGPAPAEDAAAPPQTTEQLFESAVRAHSRRLLAVARGIVGPASGNRASPEDVVQQALANLYQHRHRYDWRRPAGLLRRAVVNEALRILRQPRMGEVSPEHPGRTGGPDGCMIGDETVARVRAAIDRLPEHFRAALVLCEYEGMPYAEIAEVLGASVPQVKTWLHRGRRQLARMLKDYAGVDARRQET